MEVAEKPWFGNFDVLGATESDAFLQEGALGRKTQLAGSTGWWLVYNHPCFGNQNGNPGLHAWNELLPSTLMT